MRKNFGDVKDPWVFAKHRFSEAVPEKKILVYLVLLTCFQGTSMTVRLYLLTTHLLIYRIFVSFRAFVACVFAQINLTSSFSPTHGV